MTYIPRLKQEYKDRVVSALKEEFGYKNVMEVPKLEKIVVSRGVGAAVSDKKLVDHAVEELTKITGQKAVSTISKKDVASFKLRKGMPIGAAVVKPGRIMFEVGGVPLAVAKEALRLAAQKLPVKTKFIIARDFEA